MRSLLIAAVLCAELVACTRPTRNDNGAAPVYPERKGSESDATAQTKLAQTLKPADHEFVSLDLERTPPAGSANLWACYDVPPADFSVGRLVCADGSGKTVSLSAANVRFTCRNDPDFTPVGPSQSPSLAGCEAYDVYIDSFEGMDVTQQASVAR